MYYSVAPLTTEVYALATAATHTMFHIFLKKLYEISKTVQNFAFRSM